MSFLKKIKGKNKSKLKKYRSDSKLVLQSGLDKTAYTTRSVQPLTKEKNIITIERHTTILEEKLNKPETRSSPTSHIEVIRKLAKNYLELGKNDFSFYKKAENLFKQFNILYPLHMEKIDWIMWIEASARAKMIREARRLLQEVRLLFPGDEDIDKIETEVLHISTTT